MFLRSIFAVLFCLLAFGAGHAMPGAPKLEAPGNTLIQKVAACGWYAVFECDRTRKGARRERAATGGYVINTNRYDNFANGWFCVVKGPFRKAKARRKANRYGGYIKHSC